MSIRQPSAVQRQMQDVIYINMLVQYHVHGTEIVETSGVLFLKNANRKGSGAYLRTSLDLEFDRFRIDAKRCNAILPVQISDQRCSMQLSDKTRNATKCSGKAVEKLDDEHHMLCMFQHSVQKPFP